MGANAVTTTYDFVANQVLTAAQMDNVNCGIPVFATTTTRDAAFGGTGEKTLAQGQTCYIEATSTYQTYTGSAWVTFGAGGMPLIIAETAFTGAASVSVNNCFTSAYTNYKLILNVPTSSNAVGFRLRASGTDASTNYYAVNYDMYSHNTAISATAAQQATTYIFAGSDKTQTMGEIFNPQLAQVTGFSWQGVSWEPVTPRAQTTNTNYKGVHNAATAYDGFTIYPISGTFTGTYALYGYAKA
jgi:hypothetical protein